MNSNNFIQYIKVVHYLPGRMRIEIKGVLIKGHLCRRLGQLEQVPGLIKLQINPKTGRMLIIYDPGRLARQSILECLAIFFDSSPAAAIDESLMDSGRHPGLTDQEAVRRLAEYGPNSLPEAAKPGLIRLFTRQFDNFLAKTLLVSSVVCVLAREVSDAVSIMAIASVNAAFSAYQERNAEKALEALKQLVDPRARVERGGAVKRVPAAELVPGDLVHLEQGNRIPADLTLVWSNQLCVDESSLTGESCPVMKTPAKTSEGEGRSNIVYMGTTVSRGKGTGIVAVTGKDTEIGKISSTIKEDKKVQTPLQRELSGIGKAFVKVSSAAGLIVFSTGLIRGNPLVPTLISALSLAVTAIPEGLPTMVNIAQADGVRRVARQRTVVRKLPAIENISGTTVICTDKTGTLTKNEQALRHIYTGHRLWNFEAEGRFMYSHKDLIAALRCGCLCNDARADGSRLNGDPLEGALLVAAGRAGLDTGSLRSAFIRLEDIPFDAERGRMTVICRDDQGRVYAFVKGSPDTVIGLCGQIMCGGEARPIMEEDKINILGMRDVFAGQACRVLALAEKQILPPTQDEDPESNLTFLGLAAFSDPLRPEVGEVVRRLGQAGIKIAIITGDHGITAAAVAREAGISGDSYLTGSEIEKMDPEELGLRVKDTVIFSNMLPVQKLKVIKALQKNNETVTMIGDGVNDAPAVKLADIGVAMGGIGSDVTKQSADIIITDDNFAALAGAIMQGKALHCNIKRTVKYLLATNIGELIISFVPVITGHRMTLIPVQMFWLNLLVDSLPALALGVRPPSAGEMDKPLRSKKLVDKNVLNNSLCRGINTGLGGLAAFTLGLGSGGISRARTLSLASVTLRQISYARECSGGKIHKSLFIALASTSFLLLASIYFPPLRRMLKTHPLSLQDWLLAGATALAASMMDILCDSFFARETKKPAISRPLQK